MAAAVGEGHAFDIGARGFKSTIEEMSDRRFTINVQVGGAYVGEVEQMETLSTGGVEMLSQSVGVSHAVYAPNVLGLILPLFIDDPVFDRWTELINTAWERTGGKGAIAEEGLTITSPIAYAGLRHTTANQAIRTPSDVDGVQIRLPEVPLWPDVFSAFGFQPVALAVDELYSALQQGTVQASEGEIYQVRSQNLNEVQSHYNLTGHFPNAYYFMMNMDIYESLPEEDKELLTDASEQAVENANEQVQTSEEEVINELAGDNFQIVENVDRQAFADISTSQIESYYTENDLALTLEEVRNIIRD